MSFEICFNTPETVLAPLFRQNACFRTCTFDERSSAVWVLYVSPANALVIWAEPVNSLLGPVVVQ